MITALLDRLCVLIFGKKPPAPEQPALNRKQRRDLDKVKPGEQRMRLERTFIAQAKRRTSSRGNHGAKAQRAALLGFRRGTEYVEVQMRQAYAAGVQAERSRRSWWTRTRSRLLAAARQGVGVVNREPHGKTAAS